MRHDPSPLAAYLSHVRDRLRDACDTPGCTGKPSVTIRAVRLCRECYAAVDFQGDTE